MKQGKPGNITTICAAVRHQSVQQHASHLYHNTFEKVLAVGVSGKFLPEPHAQSTLPLALRWDLISVLLSKGICCMLMGSPSFEDSGIYIREQHASLGGANMHQILQLALDKQAFL